MNTLTLRSAFCIVEILVGLALIAMGSYSYLQSLDCPESVGGDCTGWSLFGVAALLIPGVFVTLAGALSYFRSETPLFRIQGLSICALIAYSVWLFWVP